MPAISAHVPGSFCWAELATSDPVGARKFYGSLFGWTTHEIPIGDGQVYAMQQIGGKNVAAIYGLAEGMKSVPPHWFSYIAVKDVDAIAREAKDLGGKIVSDPFDVFESGRMSVIEDSTGAPVGFWQAKENIGMELTMEPGVPCWNELHTANRKEAGSFYTGLLGWGKKESPEYTEWLLDGQSHAGMLDLQRGKGKPHWGIYFLVDDCDAAVSTAESLGGRTVVPAFDMKAVGRFALLADPQGARFSMIRLF